MATNAPFPLAASDKALILAALRAYTPPALLDLEDLGGLIDSIEQAGNVYLDYADAPPACEIDIEKFDDMDCRPLRDRGEEQFMHNACDW
ncbi:conserved protein of unknown function (plasmid) [Rhodovastum atsumiense]|uniref:Uncharacterized protein n=1 Tax=Rhodovastum atsumiense TaxID=504468 RepID=A0A5M6ITF8_9PROT|nr:hypothetical protein [Rhodovastum atsumiense]KAA5611600.1 hypothetical protein F1189_13640 [Rhodovastum atsumiense]CAH2606315.1 conserved protein of unknown function [Rhodovastum atsumiense]